MNCMVGTHQVSNSSSWVIICMQPYNVYMNAFYIETW